jgi:hypothetical protein
VAAHMDWNSLLLDCSNFCVKFRQPKKEKVARLTCSRHGFGTCTPHNPPLLICQA